MRVGLATAAVPTGTGVATTDEKTGDRLRRITADDALSVEVVSAFGGDREMTDAEVALVQEQRSSRGMMFYSDMLYAISHQYFAPEIARDLWEEIVAHKYTISARLGRNVRVTVATLDYLSNIKTDVLFAPTLMSESDVSRLAALSMRDGMTGLFNRTTCFELLDLEFRNHYRYGVGVSLLLLDIDNFKSINDHAGHREGDRVLVALAAMLLEQTRDSDVCCRVGGEEFVVILRLTDNATDACDIAERVRAGATRINSGGQHITVSVGVARLHETVTSASMLLDRADRAMYQAKACGKDRVVLSTER
jgi:diguanylate cyclase (GGDEF)-like protein